MPMSLKDAFEKETVAPRILIYDIERLSALARLWEPKTRYVPISSFVRYSQTISIAAKWYDQKKVMFHAAWESDDPHYLARKTWELFDQATHAVSYNGINFDERHIRTLWLSAGDVGLVPPRPWKSIDLYRTNRSTFGFESKSLRHLCERLGVQNKEGHYDAEQAERAMAGDVQAQKQLARYNKFDVLATEACFDRLRPWIKGMNLGLYYGTDDEPRCANCGQPGTLEPAGWASTALTRYAAYRCTSCGSLMRNNHRKHSTTIRGV